MLQAPKEKITLEVSPAVAKGLRSASPEKRERLEALIEGFFGERDFEADTRNLANVMDEISANAERRGLTPEILSQIMGDE